GEVLTWGDTAFMQGELARLPRKRGPNGRPVGFRQVSAGSSHDVAVLSDGSLQQWGVSFSAPPPPLPPGVRYVHAEAGSVHSVALRSDGQLVAWGGNSQGQCNVPPLPAGVTYLKCKVSSSHSVAIRSDGQAVSFGANINGEGTIPPPAPGTAYVDVDVYYRKTVLLRSDGVVVCLGDNSSGQGNVPALPLGMRYSGISVSSYWNVAIRSDGRAVHWGSSMWTPVPSLPFGVSYVEAEAGSSHTVLRRSDGQVVVCGVIQHHQDAVPPLAPGTSYVGVSAHFTSSAARVGPTSTFVSYGLGCAGSLPASRPVPDDTPRLGKTLNVTFFDLPQNVAVLAFGWSPLAPVDLTFLGMPACALHVDFAALLPLVGQDQQAVWTLPIPDSTLFLGTHFFAQALVVDPAAGNSFGAVVSDAAEGVIGDW
ncbi:MAG: hypothetical protein JNM25_16495, partial [Planctomycetes bacterium]|nr:hypothetical protein [Planctomycetota bacterium]